MTEFFLEEMRRVVLPVNHRRAGAIKFKRADLSASQDEAAHGAVLIALMCEIDCANSKLAGDKEAAANRAQVPLEPHGALSGKRSDESGSPELPRVT